MKSHHVCLLCWPRDKARDPIFDGVVALLFVHLGVFDIGAVDTGEKGQRDEEIAPNRRRFSKLLNRGRLSKLISTQTQSNSKPALFRFGSGKRLPRTAALSVEALIAVTDLCLQDVLSGTVLCDLLALFALGDVEDNFDVVLEDTELLRSFLCEGLMPRSASIRAKIWDADPIGDVTSMLEAMDQLKASKKAAASSALREPMSVRSSISIRPEGTQWFTLESTTSPVSHRWSQRPQPKMGSLLSLGDRGKNASRRNSLALDFERPSNMLDVLNRRTAASSRDG